MKFPAIFLSAIFSILSFTCFAQPVIYANQIGFDAKGPKIAVLSLDNNLTRKTIFNLINTATNKAEFTGVLSGPQTIEEWTPGKVYYQADFSSFKKSGKYCVQILIAGKTYKSFPFKIGFKYLNENLFRQSYSNITLRPRNQNDNVTKTNEFYFLFLEILLLKI